MIKIMLKDGSCKEYNKGITIKEVAETISPELARGALVGEVDGVIRDLSYKLENNCTLKILTFASEGGKLAYWHTTSHILAQAVKRRYPEVKLAIGPAIRNGFYYDFDSDQTFTPEVMQTLEKEMEKIIKEALPIERFTLDKIEAIKLMEERNEPYKLELIRDLPETEEISFYKQGEFVDLCAGPHLSSTNKIKAFKLTQSAGAYWRGSEKNKMLQRIYGISFPKKSELDEYLARIEEAKKRDHNKLGRELEMFTTVDYIGQGLPILMPKGAKVIQILQRFVEDEEERRGYMLTKTPFMAKSDLYKISGHWDHYREGMFVMGNEKEENAELLALRPMTCPFQFQVYLAKPRSYRDLPMRFNETSTLFRNESSGEMHGLIRVRQFTISEGHIACTPDQLDQEFANCIDLANFMLKAVGLDEDVSYRFSKWDPQNKEKYIGTEDQWEEAQNRMRQILDKLNLSYEEEEGEAAFYGPKLDIQIKNVFGKEDTLITVQIDFQLAEKFGMQYTDSDGQKKYPYVIHRTSLGCYERTLALLIEKYGGAFPTWLSPLQVKILPLSDKHHAYALEVQRLMQNRGVRVEVDARNEKIGYKIREAQMEKTPYMLVLGDKELENRTVAVRSRKEGDLGTMAIDQFTNMLAGEIAERIR
ncbi:threonine--tRNA ligase [Desulfosporosinus sp. PR]|uniref:threonine--tRNA ligase n=1 Tax=Candidatus Desulfosporosinus nitrosoreducens TaxID=3401928 RepID=UPI0027FD900E|nr:threonine--tRNA ligase [Desulfosporosinus sp. PR]MDQ7094588.1 threonine--tRNA ligase [Desulfosporosinus sp. PR]